jgi:hypothetical protein
MSNLASLAALAQGGAALADAGQAYGSYQGQLMQSKYQAGVLNQNAALAGVQAAQAQKAADFEANLRSAQGKKAVADARTYTSDAVDVNTGSAAREQADIAAAAITDRANILNNAALQRWGYGIEAANYSTQAKMAKIGGRFGANSSLISGGMRFARDLGAAGYYYKAGQVPQQNGPWGDGTSYDSGYLDQFGGR